MSRAPVIQQLRPGIEDHGLPAARQRQTLPCDQQRGLSLALGPRPSAQLYGRVGERRPEHCGRVLFPSLGGNQEEGEQGLEGQNTEKRGGRREGLTLNPLLSLMLCAAQNNLFLSSRGQIAQASRKEVLLPRPHVPVQEYCVP